MDRKPCNNGFYFMDSYLYKPVTMSITDEFWPDLAESRVLDPNIFLTNFQPSMNKTVRTASVFPFLDAIF